MPSVYGQMSKISNASGRSDYIQNPDRQEEVVLYKSDMRYSWKVHSDFEKQHSNSDKQNNEAREVIVPVDNSLYDDRKKLERVCDSLVKRNEGGYQKIEKLNNNAEYFHTISRSEEFAKHKIKRIVNNSLYRHNCKKHRKICQSLTRVTRLRDIPPPRPHGGFPPTRHGSF